MPNFGIWCQENPWFCPTDQGRKVLPVLISILESGIPPIKLCDYINSHQRLTGLAVLSAGLLVLQPEIVAPAFNLHPDGAPSLIPFLFVTIACGVALITRPSTSIPRKYWNVTGEWSSNSSSIVYDFSMVLLISRSPR